MKPAPFHPLDPGNICPANTDAARRDHERYTAQPWSLLVACGMVGSVFFWGMVAVVMSGYFVPEKEPRIISFYCPVGSFPSLSEEPEKVICFRPPPPPTTIAFKIPTPVPKEEYCPNCDIYRILPPVPDVELPPLDGEDNFGIICYGCGEDDDLLQAVLEPTDQGGTYCGVFWIDEEPRPVNLDDIQSRIRYPSPRKEGQVVVRISINEFGQYSQYEVLSETDSRFTEAIIPHLADLRFTPKIQGGRPVLAWVTIPFRFELKN